MKHTPSAPDARQGDHTGCDAADKRGRPFGRPFYITYNGRPKTYTISSMARGVFDIHSQSFLLMRMTFS